MNRLLVSRNPLVQLAGLFVGAVVTVGAILVGAVLLAFVVGLAVIAGLLFYLRLWWWRRRRTRSTASRGSANRGGRGPQDDIVEVEYTVVEERTVRDPDRR